MEILKSLPNEVLLKKTQSLVAEERRVTLSLIEHLKEIDSRMLYAGLGYQNLWDFCVKHLGLSEGSAMRRIQAMRLTREVPQTADALAQGKISLSNAAKIESFFKAEKKRGNTRSVEDKKKVIDSIEGLSQRQCEQKLLELCPEVAKKHQESVRPISEDQNVLKVILDSKTLENLVLLKARLAHRLPDANYGDVIALLVEEKLQAIEGKMKSKEKPQKETATTAAAAVNTKIEPLQVLQLSKPARKSVPVEIQRKLWARSQGKCEFVSKDGKRCGSSFALEIEHVLPVALRGSNDFSNIMHLCRIHNTYQAQKIFGRAQMAKYCPGLRFE